MYFLWIGKTLVFSSKDRAKLERLVEKLNAQSETRAYIIEEVKKKPFNPVMTYPRMGRSPNDFSGNNNITCYG